MRSGNTYTANGASEMIKEIVANIKDENLEILFRMDSGYFDEEIIETIESLDCKYLIEYRQQIKTFRLKYVFIAAKIIRTARYVIMKISYNYPYKTVYERRLS